MLKKKKLCKNRNYIVIPNVTVFDYAPTFYNQVKQLGVEIKYESVMSVFKE